jgi:hypothetical protein
MAARKESGADWNRGKDRSLSMSSRGSPWIVEAERGEGRTGRVCIVSESKDRMRLIGSGIADPFIL